MMKLSIVIVSYNVRYYLEQCLISVIRASKCIDTEIWIVDNASTDRSVDYLRSRFSNVHFIANTENKGYAHANNQAIKQCSGEYVLLLNPDTIVAEETIKGCVDFLDANPAVGATGVRMLHADGSFAPESRRGLPTPFVSFCKMSGLSARFPRSRTFGRYYMQYLDSNVPNEIEVISGAFNMLRKKALDEVGLLDETFFMYGEDIDLSYRFLMGGWKNYYLPLNILHYKGESTVKTSFKYVHTFYKAMLIFFDKHYSKKYCILGWFIRFAVYLRAFLDVFVRFVERMWPSSNTSDIQYFRLDIRSESISDKLEALRLQDENNRLPLEVISNDGKFVIRQSGIIPFENVT